LSSSLFLDESDPLFEFTPLKMILFSASLFLIFSTWISPKWLLLWLTIVQYHNCQIFDDLWDVRRLYLFVEAL
jgi:hypothetical protein